MKKLPLGIVAITTLSCMCFWVYRPKAKPAPLPKDKPTLVDNFVHNVSSLFVTVIFSNYDSLRINNL